jgi:hypothetical protein
VEYPGHYIPKRVTNAGTIRFKTVAVECIFTWYWLADLCATEGIAFVLGHALHLAPTAKVHDVNAFYRLRSVPGIGKILAVVLLYEIHDIHRFPRVQDFVSYCRLVKCAKQSDGKHYGYAGAKIGHAHLKWAFSEAAVLCLRKNPVAQRYVARLAQKHGKGKALTLLAHKLARAVYYMLRRGQAFNATKFFAWTRPDEEPARAELARAAVGEGHDASRAASPRPDLEGGRSLPLPISRGACRSRASMNNVACLPDAVGGVEHERGAKPCAPDRARGARESRPPNWTPAGTEPDPLRCSASSCGADRA